MEQHQMMEVNTSKGEHIFCCDLQPSIQEHGTFYERRRRRQQTESASCQTNEIQNISFGTNK
ncbi:unnamed protein product [Ixodes persulcatus]